MRPVSRASGGPSLVTQRALFAGVLGTLAFAISSPGCGGESRGGTSSPPRDAAAEDASGDDAGPGVLDAGPDDASDEEGRDVVVIVPALPADCMTSDGEPGILVDTFTYDGNEPKCEPLDALGTADDTCPEEELPVCNPFDCVGAHIMQGCCLPDGTCGLLDDRYYHPEKNLGCISREPWVESYSWGAGHREPVSCTP